ncbi:nitrilase-related carbon-nitrogen hydrolase [Arthrobacter sp. CAN_A1]|uniref:nitrilase-related carbon-nitrogen hydrolase n=1 Tax=Arthrobacter sp. CAN_A1 TaxID=2787717 RepID=UPI0018C97614
MARIGVWQATGKVAKTEENLARLDQMAAHAAREGIDVVVTPELFATGYAPARMYTSDGRDVRGQLADIARRRHIAIVGSSVDNVDGQRYISASFFDPEGSELTRYRKSHLFGPEEKSVFRSGADSPRVFTYAGLRLALGICYDVEFPEFVRAAARAGADALLVPTAVPFTGNVDGLPADRTYNAERISTIMVPSRAMENGIFVAYANHAPPHFTGLSCIAGPHGNVLAEAHRDEGLIVAEVDAEEVQRARRINTYFDDVRDEYPA